MVLVLTLLLLTPGDTPTATSKAFSKALQEQAVRATVKIVNPAEGGYGSGVLIKRDGAFVYILTASHVVGKAELVEVHTFTAGSAPRADKVYKAGKVLARSVGTDLAVIRLATRDVLPEPIPICPAAQTPNNKQFPALSAGCGAGRAPIPMADVVKEKKLLRRPGETTSVLCWEVERKPTPGRSGGPLVNTRGRLIGIASGHDGKSGYYTHVEEVHRFLKRNALGFLYEEAGH